METYNILQWTCSHSISSNTIYKSTLATRGSREVSRVLNLYTIEFKKPKQEHLSETVVGGNAVRQLLDPVPLTSSHLVSCEIILMYVKLSCVSFGISNMYSCHADYRSALETKLLKVCVSSHLIRGLWLPFPCPAEMPCPARDSSNGFAGNAAVAKASAPKLEFLFAHGLRIQVAAAAILPWKWPSPLTVKRFPLSVQVTVRASRGAQSKGLAFQRQQNPTSFCPEGELNGSVDLWACDICGCPHGNALLSKSPRTLGSDLSG